MALRQMTRNMPQVKLGGSQLTQAQRRAMRGVRQLPVPELSRAQKRALRAAQRTAQQTAQRIGPTADQARQIASSGMQTVRIWCAPQINRAGTYVEDELGPRVGSMLRRTAERIEPTRRRRGRRGLAATLMVAGGALGAAGAIATRRTMARKAEESGTAPTEHLTSVSDNGSTERARMP